MRHPWGAAFELIVKSKDRFTPCGCHHVIYLLASHRNPKDEDPPAAWHPDRGTRFLDRMSRGVAPKTPGYQWIPLSPTTPLGCRTDCLTGKCTPLCGVARKGNFCSATRKGSKGRDGGSVHRSPLCRRPMPMERAPFGCLIDELPRYDYPNAQMRHL